MGYIYVITNNKNNKLYIGQTTRTPMWRYVDHMRYSKPISESDTFHRDIKRFGRDNFMVFTLMSEVPNDKLDFWERYYILKYNTCKYGYNNTLGGGGILGYNHTEDTERRIRSSVNSPQYKESVYTPERNHKISVALTGREFSKEHKDKISAIAKTRYGDKNPFFGKHRSEETIHKIMQKSKPIFAIDAETGERLDFDGIYEAIGFLQKDKGVAIKRESIYLGIYRNMNKNHVWRGYTWFWKLN